VRAGASFEYDDDAFLYDVFTNSEEHREKAQPR